jgi:hypothetical protein
MEKNVDLESFKQGSYNVTPSETSKQDGRIVHSLKSISGSKYATQHPLSLFLTQYNSDARHSGAGPEQTRLSFQTSVSNYCLRNRETDGRSAGDKSRLT